MPGAAGQELPDFAAIDPAKVPAIIKKTLAAQNEALRGLAARGTPDAAWVAAVERVHEAIHNVWGPVSHLNSVVSTPSLRDAYNECLPLITDFHTSLGQNDALFRQFSRLDAEIHSGGGALAELVRHTLRDFRLAGVALPEDSKAKFREVMLELSSVQARFEQHLMDATDAFEYRTDDAAELSGLPDPVVQRARREAQDAKYDGWLLKLDPPTYIAVVTHADSESLRERYYRAWVTRASEFGENPDQWNNDPLIERILELRSQAAALLGFDNFAEMSLATKMADSSTQVLEFLDDLARRSHSAAVKERAELTRFAGRALKAWDYAYFSEKLKQKRFDLSDEALRAYFPLPVVLRGVFGLAGKLFGLEFTEVDVDGLWHPSARFYRIDDSDGTTVGGLLIDLYARANKRGGAWMDACRDRARLGPLNQNPVAYLVCNFSPPMGEEPSYLTHNDVQTLFHEFGHSLHHLLTKIDYPSIGGINGVAWDAVELPSQFFENYAWLPEVLSEISSHKDTGAPIPKGQVQTLIESRSFLGALAMVRQLEFALFDFRVHVEKPAPNRGRVQQILDQVRAEISVLPVPDFNRFQCSFAHIFGGGYAAGYYSYKWAEVLAADAFAAFDRPGPFDADTALRFRDSILAVGGSVPAMEAFKTFRGREPELEPLLRQAGIA